MRKSEQNEKYNFLKTLTSNKGNDRRGQVTRQRGNAIEVSLAFVSIAYSENLPVPCIRDAEANETL